ncbi:Chondramide synthase cmdD [Pirellulimonas nuda]|uniref:Chondramide synthase cmdD n=1 Tax=Pirellulimonas nuda TaxID=2528009 RepID=A0A518D5Y2_9BACT|nr:non-ribosomal peptide synthetase [Pirellulimonas nuda]QDU86877.1 Chondramide synthase cmdD [Pirellulimonas nuda]
MDQALAARLAALNPEQRAALERKLLQRASERGGADGIPRCAPQRRGTLSFAEQRLWLLDRLEPEHPFYNMPLAAEVTGPLDRAALAAALNDLVARHETLRYAYELVDGTPHRRVLESATIEPEWIDSSLSRKRPVSETQRPELVADRNAKHAQGATGTPGADASGSNDEALWELVREHARTPFDLNVAPLLRCVVFQQAPERYVVLLVMHHIVSDGWSMAVLMNELTACYRARSAGESSDLAPLAVQYRDYAVWQRDRLSGQRLDALQAYWKEQLGGAPPALELPIDHARPAAQDFVGGLVEIDLGAELSGALDAAARRWGATPFVVLMAGYQAWLARHTGQEDIVVGAVVAGRERSELERLIGFFVNTLAIRTRLDDDPTFVELVGRVQQTSLSAFEHQELPFDKLIEAVAPGRDPSHGALFQTALVVQNPPRDFAAAPGMTVRPVMVDNGTAKYDLTLFFWQDAGRWVGQAEYATALFERATIERFVLSFKTLLSSALQASTQRVSELDALDPSQRGRLAAWNQTDTDLGDDCLLHELFERHAAEQPNHVAVRWQGASISYAELNADADRIAASLRRLGVGYEEAVVVALPRSADSVVMLLAVLKAGGVYVPVDADGPEERWALVVEETGAAVVVVGEGISAPTPPPPAPPPAGEGSTRKRSPERTTVAALRTLPIGEAARPPAPNPSGAATTPHREAIPPSSGAAYVIYTSGSTGRPKGVVVEHRNIVNFVRAQIQRMGVSREDVLQHAFSPTFDGGLSEVVLGMSVGATLVVIDQPALLEPPAYARLLHTERVTVGKFPPALLATLEPEGLPLLTTVLTAGDRQTAKLARRWMPGRLVMNGYGPTEATVGVCIHRLSAEFTGQPPIGAPLANTRAYVLDRNQRLAPIGVTGEIYIGGAGVARGYLKRPDETAAKFLPDPFSAQPGARMYRTGDLGRWRPTPTGSGGMLEFVGRVDDQVQLRGYRVEPGEVTAALERLPLVRQAYATIVEDAAGAQQLAAYVVPQQSSADEEESEHLGAWQSLMDQSHRAAGALRDPEFDVTGWVSTYTGRPIPKQEMRQWADATAERVLALRPTNVLEIGCGTGLILLRVAPHAASYVGTDFLDRSLKQLTHVLERHADEGWPAHVDLFHQAAHEVGPLAGKKFDVIVLNSVVQYFPSFDYLLRVLQTAEGLLNPGGAIFLGDLRDLRLAEAMAAGVELARAEPTLTRRELLGRVEARLRREEELLIDPALFATLHAELPRLADVDLRLKHGAGDNELQKFRYDAVLRFDHAPAIPAAYESTNDDPAAITALLRSERYDRLVVRGVQNARVARDVALWRTLKDPAGPEDLSDVRAIDTAPLGLHPDAWRIDPPEGYDIAVRPNPEHAEQYDVWFASEQRIEPVAPRLSNPAPGGFGAEVPAFSATTPGAGLLGGGATGSMLVSRPLEERRAARLVPELRAALAKTLPQYMIPGAFVVLDELPRTTNGKIDRDALPPPPSGRPAWATGYVAPRSDEERTVAKVWEGLLGFAPIGAEDDFFALGGHSMLAVQAMSELEKRTGARLPLAALFQQPTPAHLAALLRDPEGAQRASSLVPLQTEGNGAPLFCIHPAGGAVFCYRELAEHFAGKRPVYGIQAVGVDGAAPPHETMTELAEHYARVIREHTPTNPIHLCGWSLGGNIAQAVAIKLKTEGAEVGLLGLFDAGAVPSEEDLDESNLAPLLQALFPDLEHLPIDELRQLGPDEQAAYFTERAVEAGLVDAAQLAASAHIYQVFQKNVGAVHSHRAEYYPGRVALFRAAEQTKTSTLSDDRELGWGPLCAGVDVYDVPSDHAQMMQSPGVEVLAGLVEGCLSLAETQRR